MATFDQAIKKAVKAFYDGSSFESYEKGGNTLKYNLDYFDDIEKGFKRKTKKETEVEPEVEEETDDLEAFVELGEDE